MANLDHDSLKNILEGPAAKVYDLTMRHAVILMVVKLVRILTGWESNMAGSKEEDLIAPTSFTEIETPSSFKVREGLGSNLETKCWSEWATHASCWIIGGD